MRRAACPTKRIHSPTVDRARFSQVKDLFRQASALRGAQREELLDRSCAGDAELRAEVADLLAHASAATGLFDEDREARPTFHFQLAIPGFRLIEVIGAGGSSIVYRAEQEHPRRDVAIKVLRLESLGPEQVARFRREARILGSLTHPGIARIFEAGVVTDGSASLPWLAIEYVRGASLSKHVETNAPGTRELLDLFLAICGAVEHAHQLGIVHRDLKPSNVIVEADGGPRVLDFGVARVLEDGSGSVPAATRTGTLVGTLAYIAPEQARGERTVDARADVYSLGVILFELMTGRLPLDVDDLDVVEAVRVVCTAEPARLRRARPELPSDLDAILAKALEKEPARRYASAGHLAADVANLLAERPVSARRPTALYQARKFVRRNRALALGLGTVIAALTLGLGAALISLRQERIQRARTSETLDFVSGMLLGFAPKLGFGEERRDELESVLGRIDRQLELDPGNRPLRVVRADLLFELATLDQSKGDHARTKERADEMRRACESLAAERPADVGAWTRLSRSCAKLGEAERELGDLAARDRWFERTLEIDERLVRENPGDLELVEDLGWSLARVAAVAAERGDLERDEQLVRRRLADAEPLVAREPDNWKYVFNLSHTHHLISALCARHGDAAAAAAHAGRAVELARRLLELEPDRRDFLSWLVDAERSAGHRAEQGGDPRAARGHGRAALEVAEQIATAEPGRRDHLERLRVAARDLARFEVACGDRAGALRAASSLRRAVDGSRRLGHQPVHDALLEEAASIEARSAARD